MAIDAPFDVRLAGKDGNTCNKTEQGDECWTLDHTFISGRTKGRMDRPKKTESEDAASRRRILCPPRIW
jgi:hypothetical protein